MINIVGIDPGLDGAMVVLKISDRSSLRVSFHDTPVIIIKGKKYYMPAAMASYFSGIDGGADHVFIERVGAMPGQGVVSMFSLGYGAGLWLGIVAAFGIPYALVPPMTWKRQLGLIGGDKNASRLRATQLFPEYCTNLLRKKDHGRAEALLLAEYGRQKMCL